jgi:hypothetical protein
MTDHTKALDILRQYERNAGPVFGDLDRERVAELERHALRMAQIDEAIKARDAERAVLRISIAVLEGDQDA